MTDVHLHYFRGRLLAWRDEVLKEEKEVKKRLKENQNEGDRFDGGGAIEERAIELRANDRGRSLIAEIDAALKRIDAETNGYCEETGDPIGLQRLEAWPIAKLSVEAQE